MSANNSYLACRSVELNSMNQLWPQLLEYALGGHLVLTEQGRLSELFQKEFGDVIMHRPDGGFWCIELKAEQRFTGNLFLETWSNMKKFKPGWMVTLNADLLWYHFLDVQKVYIMDFQALQDWAFRLGRLYDFREIRQSKYVQANEAYGRIVPIEVLQEEVGVMVRDVMG